METNLLEPEVVAAVTTSYISPAVWPQLIPAEQWAVYDRVLRLASERRIRFALGGAFALAQYSGRWRNTKDMDLYVLPSDRGAMIDVVHNAGLVDYYDRQAYDRAWIYRSHENGTIVDIIWSMANQRAQVDEAWLRGPQVAVNGGIYRIVPAEEMIWAKLYVMQRDRCDWTDVMNMIYGAGASLDWEHLLRRIGDDLPLLKGVLSVYSWLCPGGIAALPAWLCEKLAIDAPRMPEETETPETDGHRVNLLDSRPWFATMLPGLQAT